MKLRMKISPYSVLLTIKIVNISIYIGYFIVG